MKYGQIYSQLSSQTLKKVFKKPKWQLFLLKAYFYLFGFPNLGNHLQFPTVISFLQPQKGEKILDAGCGNGLYALEIARQFKAHCVGVDLDQARIGTAQFQAQSLNLSAEFERMSLTNLKFPKGYFDKVLLIQALQFIRNDEKAIKELTRVLKKRGILILAFPGEKYYGSIKNPAFRRKTTMIVKKGGYLKGTMRRLLARAGFKILETKLASGTLFKKLAFWQNSLYLKNLETLNLLSFPLFLCLVKIDILLRKADPSEAVYILKAIKK